MICMKCGQQNPSGWNFCQRCNTTLPRVPQAVDDAPHLQVNERYLQLVEAGESVLHGTWSLPEYARFIERMSQSLAVKEQEIREIEIPPEALDEFREELETGFSGIELYAQGVTEMRLFLADRNPVHVERGLELAREGNDLINEAMRINRDNRRVLEEVYFDSSTTI